MKRPVVILLLLFLFAGGAWFFFTSQPEPIDELPPPPMAPVTATGDQVIPPLPGENNVAAEPEFVPIREPLPPLDESDTKVTWALEEIVGAEALAQYLVKSQAISRIVATTDSLTSRQVPSQINPLRPVDDKFIVDREGDEIVLSPLNFARYDGYVEIVRQMDGRALIDFYQDYYPLFQQAWEQNGGQGPFSERLVEVIDTLLETPDVTGPVYLTKPEAVYLFADPNLEAMTAGQKVLIRMGSANAAVVKEKLAEVSTMLGQ